MKIIGNINRTVCDDLKENIKRDSKISIAVECFSMYIYEELKTIKRYKTVSIYLYVIYICKRKDGKIKEEIYIPRLSRESSTCRYLK